MRKQNLILFLSGRGHYGPGHHKLTCHLHRYWWNCTKILDLVPFSVWMVPEKSLMEFIFEIFEKSLKKLFDSLDIRGSPPCKKKIKSVQKHFFYQKIILSSFWISSVHVLSFCLRYMTLMYLKVSNFDYFCLKFSFFSQWPSAVFLIVFFGVSMDS